MMLPQFYPPIIGGEERFAQDLSRALARRGHEVSVVTLWQPGLDEAEMDEGVRIHRVRGLTQSMPFLYTDDDRRLATPYPDPGVARRLKEIVDQERPEVLHGHNWMVYSGFPLKRRSGARLVWTMGDHSLVCAKKKLIWFRGGDCTGPGLARCLRCASDHYGPAKGVPTTLGNFAMAALARRRLVDRFLPVSRSVADRCGLPAAGAPYEVAPNFVPDDLVARTAETDATAEELPEGEFLLYVGALGRYKGVDVLLDAYGRLDTPPPLVLIGYETSEYPIATTDPPAGVRILTNWDHGAVMQAWRRATIGVIPSVWQEPFGIVALEAMATATPVVASRIGGLTDIVEDGRTGRLVAPGDAGALASALGGLLADPALRNRMAEQGRDRVRRFTESAVVPRFERIYEDVLAGRPPARPAPPG